MKKVLKLKCHTLIQLLKPPWQMLYLGFSKIPPGQILYLDLSKIPPGQIARVKSPCSGCCSIAWYKSEMKKK